MTHPGHPVYVSTPSVYLKPPNWTPAGEGHVVHDKGIGELHVFKVKAEPSASAKTLTSAKSSVGNWRLSLNVCGDPYDNAVLYEDVNLTRVCRMAERVARVMVDLREVLDGDAEMTPCEQATEMMRLAAAIVVQNGGPITLMPRTLEALPRDVTLTTTSTVLGGIEVNVK